MDFDNNRPIYIQIMEYIKIAIIKGEFKSGTKLPSVRDMAIYFTINPNTIQRSLMELEREGLIQTKRTSGKFVTEDKQKIKNVKQQLATTTIHKFLLDMNNLGIYDEEIIKLLEERRENK